jgi:hypothetical protein
MALTYGFFDSVNGDRKYSADDISNYFLKLISNGVFATPSNAMQVQPSSGMTVQVTAGWAFINCKWLNNSAPYLLTCDAADVAMRRIDRVVLKLDPSVGVRAISMYIKKGTPAASGATPPALTRVDGGVWELSLAQINIPAGTTEITAAHIEDEREDTSLCGLVTGLIDQIDTTNLFQQYNAAFNQWFDTVKDTLLSNTLVRSYQGFYTTLDADEDVITINVPQYNYALDILNVYINGLKLVEGEDYTLNGAAGTITLTNALEVIGTPVEFEVIKSIDGSDAESIVSLVYQLQILVNSVNTRMGGLTFMKVTQTQYDNMQSHDANTLYVIVDAV